MKRLLVISMIWMLTLTVRAQGLLPVGDSNPGEMIRVANSGNAMFAVTVGSNGSYELWELNNSTWQAHGAIPNFPAHGATKDGEFYVRDLIEFNGKIYVLADFLINTSGNQNDMVLEYNGKTWTDISNSILKQSERLVKFLHYDNALLVVGLFDGIESNMLRLQSDNSWEVLGGLLTLNPQKDYFTDLEVLDHKIFASGRFTRRVGPDPFATALFDGNSWSSVTHPPFLTSANHFTIFNEQLVLTGTPNKTSDYVKSFNGAGWDDISQGLELYEVLTFYDASSDGRVLYVTGDFKLKSDGSKFNLLMYTEGSWRPVQWNYVASQLYLISGKEGTFVYGNFEVYGISNMAKIGSADAMIEGFVYEDRNKNCKWDNNEPPVSNQLIVLEPGNYVFWTNANGRYFIPVSKGSFTIRPTGLVKYATNCHSELKVAADRMGNFKLPELGLQLVNDVVDLKVTSGLGNGFRLTTTGQNEGTFKLENNGTAEIADVRFVLTMSDMWSSLTFNPAFSIQEGNQYVWICKNLKPGEARWITMTGQLKQPLTASDLKISYEGIVTGGQKDVNPDDNLKEYRLTETSSIEPIHKHSGTGSYFNEESGLSYYIRFANVGKGSVDKVVVRDTIDQDVFLGKKGITYFTSHPDHTEFHFEFIKVANNYRYVLFWTYNDINLPDSTAGGLKHVGYVELGISMAKGYHPSGTQVCNTAEVFFDQQEPYATNEVCSEARNVSDGFLPIISELKVYPNPADEILRISNASSISYTIEIHNSNGQLIQQMVVPGLTSLQFDISSWAKGVYFVKINGYECRKLLVQ